MESESLFSSEIIKVTIIKCDKVSIQHFQPLSKRKKKFRNQKRVKTIINTDLKGLQLVEKHHSFVEVDNGVVQRLQFGLQRVVSSLVVLARHGEVDEMALLRKLE